jgi:MFS family permease
MSRLAHRLHDAARPLRRTGRRARRRLITAVGGEARARVIVLLALVLALSSADTSTIGAAAAPLKEALHIDYTEIGLLVALPSLAAAVATVPVGALTDHVCRVRLLRWSIVLWSVAMIAAGASGTFAMLLISRIAIGVVTATSGPTLASLTGDFFAPSERGRIYGFILTGDLVGSVVGLFLSGNAAAISWRWAFWVLVIPSAVLAWAIWRFMPEPARGGSSRLPPADGEAPGHRPGAGDAAPEVEQAVRAAGVRPRAENVRGPDSRDMSLREALRYVLGVRTNVALIVASSLGYFFIGGVLTFGVVFIRHHYGVGQSVATDLLGVLAIAAVIGVLVSGRLADSLVRRGHVSGRVTVAAGAFLSACALFLPPLLSGSLIIGLPLLWLAGAALYGSNPPLDAARLDIMPSWLWGRAEGVRTLLRSVATASAPLLFGFVSDQLGRGHATYTSGQSANAGGITDAFLIMLVPLFVGGLILLGARRTYPRDVATAAASEAAADEGNQEELRRSRP